MLKKPEWNINHEINKKKTLILKLNIIMLKLKTLELKYKHKKYKTFRY